MMVCGADRIINRILALLNPRQQVERLQDIDLPGLQVLGFRGLIFDLDNTLIPWDCNQLDADIVKWLKNVQTAGWALAIVSNNRISRVANVAENFGIPYVARAYKPTARGFLQAAALLNLPPTAVAVVGDQLFTDVLGGNRLEMHTVWGATARRACTGRRPPDSLVGMLDRQEITGKRFDVMNINTAGQKKQTQQIGSKTRTVGILGWPLGHTLSPLMHNAAFAATGLDYVYLPFPVAPEQLAAAINGLKALGFAGANVTIPHKITVQAYLDRIDASAQMAGAVNTIVFRDGQSTGYNTDAGGFIGSLSAVNRQMDGKSAVLLGAGGAARAIATGLVNQGCRCLTIVSREKKTGGGTDSSVCRIGGNETVRLAG